MTYFMSSKTLKPNLSNSVSNKINGRYVEQLLNQLDGAGGPPPASKDQIDALPLVTIDQEKVGKLL